LRSHHLPESQRSPSGLRQQHHQRLLAVQCSGRDCWLQMSQDFSAAGRRHDLTLATPSGSRQPDRPLSQVYTCFAPPGVARPPTLDRFSFIVAVASDLWTLRSGLRHTRIAQLQHPLSLSSHYPFLYSRGESMSFPHPLLSTLRSLSEGFAPREDLSSLTVTV
jgi:hypothetical protein